jgi:CubicO group peptidase (beta-lactamase class C family)
MVKGEVNLQRSEEFILSRMSAYKVPGVSIAITTGKGVIYSRGFGYRDLENGLPSTPGTLYCIGSITKSFMSFYNSSYEKSRFSS